MVELAIFPEDVRVPLETVERLWKVTAELDDLDTEDHCVKFFGFALLLKLDLATRHILLHDVVRRYLGGTCGDRLPALHSQFVAGYGVERWSHLSSAEPYLWHTLSYHLANAGRVDELGALLVDFDWLQAKLLVTEVNALLEDYNYHQGDRVVRSVEGALRLSAHVLTKDRTQLAGQLWGRLSDARSPTIQNLLKQAMVSQLGPWLRPLKPTLTPPGGPLLRTIEAHTDWVNGVAVTPDGRLAVSASKDSTLKVWDLASGEVVHTLEGHAAIVHGVAVTPDGRRAVSASQDGALKVWDLASGEVIHTLEGHTKSVRSVAVTPDGRHAVSASDDNTLKVWGLASGTAEAIFATDGAANCCAVLADGVTVVGGDRLGRVHFLRLENAC